MLFANTPENHTVSSLVFSVSSYILVLRYFHYLGLLEAVCLFRIGSLRPETFTVFRIYVTGRLCRFESSLGAEVLNLQT